MIGTPTKPKRMGGGGHIPSVGEERKGSCANRLAFSGLLQNSKSRRAGSPTGAAGGHTRRRGMTSEEEDVNRERMREMGRRGRLT